jgi:hypothetical protein
MHNIISTPLIFPKVEPDDWDVWWKLWNKNSKFLMKVVNNHNEGRARWLGMDIYVGHGIDSAQVTGYHAPYIPYPELFKKLLDNIDQLPINVKVIRAVSSIYEVSPHSDFLTPNFSVRSLLHDTNPTSTFYYQFNDTKVYQQLPIDSNTWGYWDHKSKHGTDHYSGRRKILLMYYGTTKEDMDISNSIEHYADYVIK